MRSKHRKTVGEECSVEGMKTEERTTLEGLKTRPTADGIDGGRWVGSTPSGEAVAGKNEI